MPERLGPGQTAYQLLSDQKDLPTHKTFVVKSFMSQTTKLVPPFPHPTDPRLCFPADLLFPYVALSSSNILYSFLMNSLGPAWPPASAPPCADALRVLFDEPLVSSSATDARPATAGP